jgi:general secretion pathway protein K
MLLLGMIAVLTAVVARSVSGATVELSIARAAIFSDSDLRAGIELGVAAILKLGEKMRVADAETSVANRRIAVHITNERARIDLNRAPLAVLTALLVANGVDTSDADKLAGAVQDWRGSSPSQKLAAAAPTQGLGIHLPGLSSSDSAAVGFGGTEAPHQIVGTRYFFHPSQLSSVPGFSPRLVKSILPLVTVANGSAQIDPYIASQRVLEAFPDMTPSKVQGFIDARDGNTSRSMAILQLGIDKSFVVDTAAVGWRLEIAIKDRAGHVRRREAVVIVTEDDDKPYRVVYASGDRLDSPPGRDEQ